MSFFEYRTPLSWWIFAFSSLGALAIMLLTVSFQAIRAAMMNPVNSLRTEYPSEAKVTSKERRGTKP